ncbi:MAG: glycosyltransferase family 4 protein [Asgard group archaeon]|nr:glycosyltransferase family 4 protein [Asgard group archaeon]
MICFFTERFSASDIGGLKSYLRHMCHSLQKKDHEVAIITLLSLRDSKKKEVIDEIPVYRLFCGDFIDRIYEYNQLSPEEKSEKESTLFHENDIELTSFLLAKSLNEFLDEHKVYSIHFHNSFFLGPNALYILKQQFPRRYVPSFYFWCHSPDKYLVLPNGENSSLYDALASFQNQFKRIFAVSQAVHDELLHAGISSTVNYLGIDCDFFKKQEINQEQLLNECNFPDNSFVYLYSGRLLEEKGLGILPDIFQNLLNRDSSFAKGRFLILGEGEFAETLQKKISEKSLEDYFHITFTLDNEKLREYYSLADLFIYPTKREALGLSLLEAMSCSLPCIASDLPATAEVIHHLQNGILVPMNNHNEFIRWISTLYNDKALRNSLGFKAHKTIKEKFSHKKHLEFFLRKLIH